ncbi:unnamed protein product [Macrosiphum euphorbiae]|uniref:Uncharacterized protein n=1 Tax=Macrosiphum euphorbiae TaxID=13131 RepID=A0AAV0WKH3_9HEMI|nr:unnamed protein product [Macrosiphum euphorbiae]
MGSNYKGCTIYQTISRKHNNNTSSKKAQQLPPPNLNTNPEYQQQQPGSENTPRSRTYANVTEGHQSPNSNTSTNTNETSLLKFLDEFKSIYYRFITLLSLSLPPSSQISLNCKFHSHHNPLISQLSTNAIPGDPRRRLKRTWCRDLLILKLFIPLPPLILSY